MRKTLLLTIAVICLAQISNAQISKGSLFLGGSLSFGSSSNKDQNTSTQDSKSSGWNISPQFGKAIATNKIVGVYVNFSHNNFESGSGTQLQQRPSNTYGGGVFYRRYYPLPSRFYLFGEASLGTSIGKEEQKYGGSLQTQTERTSIGFSITPGISYAASSKLYLEASLNSLANLYYQWAKTTTYPPATGGVTSISNQKQFGVAANGNGTSGISIGLRWILPSKS
ncbi:outer membrane beta-barrel protein [Flavisolibacter ginsenosidimutans]|uniref:Outer membrane beta-barrel protein n=1 Tax=Flavisolibacter ginsenosidimutans TaxID=661481 RepID=A0A5B8ULU7_9BACT|nr:outer membrane beta-barrel protein [Flavisolibacter ginsenosidimutans]QEC57558.1 outer membrane beta-barrel protein [Flavisolibacter ginsenosidimutans]